MPSLGNMGMGKEQCAVVVSLLEVLAVGSLKSKLSQAKKKEFSAAGGGEWPTWTGTPEATSRRRSTSARRYESIAGMPSTGCVPVIVGNADNLSSCLSSTERQPSDSMSPLLPSASSPSSLASPALQACSPSADERMGGRAVGQRGGRTDVRVDVLPAGGRRDGQAG